MLKVSRILGKRNQPRRSKSRWRKTLERRQRPHVVIDANRFSPIITIRFRAPSQEEVNRLMIENQKRLAVLGTACVLRLSPEAIATLMGKE